MEWWGWVIAGALLFIAELFGVDAAFYLIFIGASALIVGLADFLGMDLPVWGEVIVFGLLSVFSMVLFRRRIYNKFRGVAAEFNMSPTGDTVTLSESLQPGEKGRADYRGSSWTVVNIDQVELMAGSNVIIKEIGSTTLKVSQAE